MFVITTNKIGTRFDTEPLIIRIFTLNKFSVINETLQKYFVESVLRIVKTKNTQSSYVYINKVYVFRLGLKQLKIKIILLKLTQLLCVPICTIISIYI